MNRTLSALFSALEAVIVLAVGLVIPLAPLTALWAVQYGFAPNWAGFWRLGADAWLLGHGDDIRVTLSAATVKASGLAGAGTPFTITIAVLGFAFLTVVLARRAGRRIAETNHRLLGEVVAVLVFAGASLSIAVRHSCLGWSWPASVRFRSGTGGGLIPGRSSGPPCAAEQRPRRACCWLPV
jgi:hypothetical protein